MGTTCQEVAQRDLIRRAMIRATTRDDKNRGRRCDVTYYDITSADIAPCQGRRQLARRVCRGAVRDRGARWRRERAVGRPAPVSLRREEGSTCRSPCVFLAEGVGCLFKTRSGSFHEPLGRISREHMFLRSERTVRSRRALARAQDASCCWDGLWNHHRPPPAAYDIL